MDELWSFVYDKGNEQWVWLVLDVVTRKIERGSAPNLVRQAQVSFVGCYIGDWLCHCAERNRKVSAIALLFELINS